MLLSGKHFFADHHQLLMFIHTPESSFTDEEGLNVTHQMLTAFVQGAAPILVSENMWQHVVLRKERFSQALKDTTSMQSSIVDLYKVTNQTIAKSLGDYNIVNKSLHHTWYAKKYPKLAVLDPQVLKHLLFDFFCYYVFDYVDDFTAYRLPEGYLLCLPKNKQTGFCLQQVKRVNLKQLEKPIFSKKSANVHTVLKKYICTNKKQSWCFYVTGHGYHKDSIHPESLVAGMPINAFKQLLSTLNNKTFQTALLAYSSCYAAGEHSILSYQQEVKGVKKDLILDYPVLMMSLTDAPTYVFGVPSGFKLPPYGRGTILRSSDVYKNALQFYFLQNFNDFCEAACKGQCTIKMARALNPYIRCISSACDVTKVENLPLVRQAHQSCFVPLDKSVVQCLTKPGHHEIIVDNKAALLWYIKQYSSSIILQGQLPAFVSMIPGSQVHHGARIVAQNVDLQKLVASLFLSIDDTHTQNLYIFDRVECSIALTDISEKQLDALENVVVLSTGSWLPAFAQQDASCYLYGEYKQQGYWIVFNQHKEIQSVIKLDPDQQDIMYRFRLLLMQECSFGRQLSIPQLLSSDYFEQSRALQKELLAQCLQQQICKSVD